MIKHCIICGAPFAAPPSSKKITCSPACSRERKRRSHTAVHNQWNAPARLRKSRDMRALGYTETARRGLAAAMALPGSQRGETHRSAKRWRLIAPDGTQYDVTNLTHWARQHAEWFDAIASESDRDRVARNIRSGFAAIALTLSGRRKHPIHTYKGWRLGDYPRGKNE